MRNGRIGAALALAAGLVLTGCAHQVSGHGTMAEASGTSLPLPTGTSVPTGTDTPTDTPTGNAPTLSLPTGTGANPNPEVPDSPCDVVDKNLVKQQFGNDVQTERDQDSCKYTDHDGNFIAFNHYASLSLNFEKQDYTDGKAATIAGRPAWVAQQDQYFIISRSTNPSQRGILTMFVGFAVGGQVHGIQLGNLLMAQIMPHYQD